jgi:hypothetical protein
MTTLMPVRVIKSRVSQLRNHRPQDYTPLRANDIEDARLVEFLTSAIFCSRPKQLIRIRAVADAPLGHSSIALSTAEQLPLRGGISLTTCISDLAMGCRKTPGMPAVQLTIVGCEDRDAKILDCLDGQCFDGCVTVAVVSATKHDKRLLPYQKE